MLISSSREFLSSIWPIGEYQVSGKRLQRMFKSLIEQDEKKSEKEPSEHRAKEIKRSKRDPDLEDGEIASDREERRARDPYRDDRRDYRREERRDERRDERTDSRRPNYYGNGDRLDFHRHRDRVTVRPSRPGQARSPPARNSPY